MIIGPYASQNCFIRGFCLLIIAKNKLISLADFHQFFHFHSNARFRIRGVDDL